MASAVHNIEGPSNIPTGWELKDGAGGIDATLADETAKTHQLSATDPCFGPCWWSASVSTSSFPVGTYLWRYFRASQGEHVRVAIAWWSNPDCPDGDHCSYDRLDWDLDLVIQGPNGQWVPGGYSASYNNNYELVEFTAPSTGQYGIGVFNARADNQPSNFLGIALSRTGTYLPDIASNYDGWQSEIAVRNDGAVSRTVTVTLFETGGSFKGSLTFPDLQPRQTLLYKPGYYNYTGSAIVNGSEDLSVVVVNDKGSQAYAYNGSPSIGSVCGIGSGTSILVPSFFRNYYNWYSDLYVRNDSSVPTTAYAYFFKNDGSPQPGPQPQQKNLSANGQVIFQPGSNYSSEGSVQVTASQPL